METRNTRGKYASDDELDLGLVPKKKQPSSGKKKKKKKSRGTVIVVSLLGVLVLLAGAILLVKYNERLKEERYDAIINGATFQQGI